MSASDLPTGVRHRRAFVGPAHLYDVGSALQFNLLTMLGLREQHSLLDIGCGSLAAGRLFITYLASGRYCGVEPERWLVEEGIEHELGRDVIDLKRPDIRHFDDFGVTRFERTFDFVLAHSIFSHSDETAMRTCLAQVREVLAPRGLFVASFVPGDVNYRGQGWMYPGNVTYTTQHMIDVARAEGLSARPLDWPQHTGQVWLVYTHPGHESEVLTGESSVDLRWRFQTALAALERLNTHPWVRIGRQVNRNLRKATVRFR